MYHVFLHQIIVQGSGHLFITQFDFLLLLIFTMIRIYRIKGLFLLEVLIALGYSLDDIACYREEEVEGSRIICLVLEDWEYYFFLEDILDEMEEGEGCSTEFHLGKVKVEAYFLEF